MKKPKNIKNAHIILIAAVIIVAGSSLVYYSSGEGSTGFLTSLIPKCGEVQVAYEVQEPYIKIISVTESVPYTYTLCNIKERAELEYESTINQLEKTVACSREESVCIRMGARDCLEWTTVCSAYTETASFEITSLEGVAGAWYFDWLVECAENQPNCRLGGPELYYRDGIVLGPHETARVAAFVTYPADSRQTLSANFAAIPTKPACEDFTASKAVRTEKPTIDYTTVTKYRTETQC